MPEELVHDSDAQELQSAIEVMQAEFITVHKELEALRETSADPATLKRRIANLEEERDQLGSKIQSTKAKVNGKVAGPKLEQLRQLSSALRREREREVELQVGDERRLAMPRFQSCSLSIGSPFACLYTIQEKSPWVVVYVAELGARS